MPCLRPRSYLLAAAAILLALAVACGGSKSSNNTDSSSASDSGSGQALQQVSLSESTAKLADLKSFRYDFKLNIDLGDAPSAGSGGEGDAFGAALLALFSNIQAEGAYVAPDQVQVSTTFAGQKFEFIQIGDEAWQNDGSGWETTDAGSSMFDLSSGPTSMFNDLLPQQVLNVASTKHEKVNGVDTTRYSFDKDSLMQAAEAMGETDTTGLSDVESADLSLWLTDNGIPVKVSVNLAGKDDSGQEVSFTLEMNINDINSDSIQIDRPI